ncbi:uncharacterized protein TNCV_2382281 [Trichonephila clavipes]|nr:uncharacterized protein TNCV_2382281 [Trichonephila clavipes]
MSVTFVSPTNIPNKPLRTSKPVGAPRSPSTHYLDRDAVTLPEKPDVLEYAAREGHVRACIIYQEPNTKRVFVLFCKDNWYQKKTLLDDFKRANLEAKHVTEFRPDDVLWEKISKGLLRNPDRPLKNTDKRMVYICNMFFVKKDFTFGFRTVKSGEIHLIQTTHAPMQIFEFPSSSLRCRANPNLFRRSFEPFDQMLYHRMVLEPHTEYLIPAGTRYILLTVQKTVFGSDIITEMILPQLMENEFNLGDFRQRKRFDQKAYKLPPPTPAHVPAETNKRPLEQQPGPFSKKKRVFITPVIRPPVALVLIARPFTALSTPQPILLPDPPSKQTTPQILLPDPPVVETLEPTLTDDCSMDQIMSSVFGDYLQQEIPSAHSQEPQVLDTVPSLFDESNDLKKPPWT